MDPMKTSLKVQGFHPVLVPVSGVLSLSVDKYRSLEIGSSQGMQVRELHRSPMKKTHLPVLEALLLGAWDLAADAEDQPGGQRPQIMPQTDKPFVTSMVKFPGKTLRFPWPFPAWPACVEYQRFANDWKKIVDDSGAVLAKADFKKASVGDPVAGVYLRMLEGLWFRNNSAYRLAMDTRPEDFRVTFKTLRRPRKNLAGQGPRGAAFYACSEDLPLLATPEAGLSDAACETLLSEIESEDLLQPRRMKWIEDSIKAAKASVTAADVVQWIAKTWPDHPWHKLVGSAS